MAEVVGTASAIASLVVIAAQITRLSYSIISDIKDAPKTQKLYLQEVSALADVLLRSEQAALETERVCLQGSRPATISGSVLSAVSKELSSIQEDLEGGISRAQWLLKKKGLRKRVDQLQNFRAVFANYIASSTLVTTTAMYGKLGKLSVDNKRDRLLSWLKDGEEDSQSLPIATAGTGKRFMKSTEYIEMLESGRDPWIDVEPGHSLWCHGAPGSGKSMLASIITRDLFSRPDKQVGLVAYYFCDFATREQQTTTTILRSLLRQFAREANEKTLSSMVAIQNGVQQEPTVEDLSAMLDATSTNYSGSAHFVILDAPDELDDSSPIISIVLGRKNLRVIITSRDTPKLRHQLQYARTFEVVANRHDLALFVEARFRELEWLFPRTVLLDIADEIVKRAHGL